MAHKQGPMKLYEVTVPGFGTELVNARSTGSARMAAYRMLPAVDISFKEFLQEYAPRVQRFHGTPSPDGYDKVREQYGVDVRIGDRVRVKDRPDGPEEWGTVLYPGPSTAHVHLDIDGHEQELTVHPLSIVETLRSELVTDDDSEPAAPSMSS